MTKSQKVDEINIVTIVIIAYRGFFYNREFTYKLKDFWNKHTFLSTSLLWLDITFSDLKEHVIVSLKRSKTDYNYISINIIIAVIGTLTCPVRVLYCLFKEDL
jgi:hypothetical protein